MVVLLTESLLSLVQHYESMYRYAYIVSTIYFQETMHRSCDLALLLMLLTLLLPLLLILTVLLILCACCLMVLHKKMSSHLLVQVSRA
jgi:lipopolysaccharide/colanic/teichoic acid biosynthesis glycosyltransferase